MLTRLLNDASAIALADVELAMGIADTDATLETADVVLTSDNLSRIPYVYSLSKATVRNMKQNMFFAVGIVVLLLVGYKQRDRKVAKDCSSEVIPEVN